MPATCQLVITPSRGDVTRTAPVGGTASCASVLVQAAVPTQPTCPWLLLSGLGPIVIVSAAAAGAGAAATPSAGVTARRGGRLPCSTYARPRPAASGPVSAAGRSLLQPARRTSSRRTAHLPE